MLEYNGLGISSTDGDISLSYAEAMKAVDGACTTCLVADAPDANYFMVSLPVSPPGDVGGWWVTCLWQ